ncbi:MAG: hypothetical protein ACTSVI_07315 [Promethearchaeota archaeon]
MERYVIALLASLVSLAIIGMVISKTKENKKQLMVTIVLGIVIYIGIAIFFNIGNVSNWTPAVDMVNFFQGIEIHDIIFYFIIMFFYAISGITLGIGLPQLFEKMKHDTKLMNASMAKKRFYEAFITLLKIYLVFSIIVFTTIALLDAIGLLYIDHDYRMILNYMIISPMPWELSGLYLAFFKFWRTRSFNFNFYILGDPKFMNPEKIYFHKIFILLLFPLLTWTIVILDMYQLMHPARFIFLISLLVGFFIFLSSRKIERFQEQFNT